MSEAKSTGALSGLSTSVDRMEYFLNSWVILNNLSGRESGEKKEPKTE
ncbi:hypothetical protein [Tumidithrix helvetica]